MKAELSVIKLFLEHSVWLEYGQDLTAKDFPEDLQLLYRTLESHHKTQDTSLSLLDLASLFFSNNPKDKEFYEQVFDTLDKQDVSLEATKTLITHMKRAKILRELSIGSYEVAEGKKPFDSLNKLLQALQEEKEESTPEEEFVTLSLSEIVNQTFKAPGLRWRLPSLNKALGSLRKGNFGFIFMRPESGKTTLLASEISYMLDQVQQGSPIIWFNNEQVGAEVMLRVYQAYFNLTTEQLLSNIAKWEELFVQATKGKFLMIDRAQLHKNFVEKICKRYNPSLIIFDQIDKIQGFDTDRNDLQLGAIYIWARELAKKFCAVIGICQADATGENQKWLTMNNVANAKTSKQAEADWILGGGTIHDTGWENVRFFHLSKNKLHGDEDSDPKMRHGRWEVLIDPECARYKDLK